MPAPEPGERPFTVAFGPKRLAEFSLGRASARCALKRLGHAPAVIPVGANREPVWPSGIVGSISHTDNVAASAVSLKASFAALGLDIEPAEPLEAGVWERICRPGELDDVPDTLGPAGLRARLIFSAKESVYKALWPVTGRFLEFHDLGIQFDPASSQFVASFYNTPGLGECSARMEGRFMLTSRLIATGVVVRTRP